MNGPQQYNEERDFARDQATCVNRAGLAAAFDDVLIKAGQLQALLALMAITAIDDEVIPVHRLAVCHIALALVQDVVTSAEQFATY